MAHILLFDVPGGNDFAVLEDAIAAGHKVFFVTSDLGHYRRQGQVTEDALKLATKIIEVAPYSYAAFEQRLCELHAVDRIDAIICLLDIRLIDASRIAERLDIRFLNVKSAVLMRDKVAVREAVATQGIRQPRFASACRLQELEQAMEEVGYPALVKPADGYGSQQVTLLKSTSDLERFKLVFESYMGNPRDYGLGVFAGKRFSVEQYISGKLVGCDIFSRSNDRLLVGINQKLMFEPPSFAMRGSCFPAPSVNGRAVRDFAFSVLDAVKFDFGASHVEIIIANDGLYLVEINPRLVSAQIPYQMGYAYERSIYADLIDLHLGTPLSSLSKYVPQWFSTIRWITAPHQGILKAIHLPDSVDPRIRRVAIFKGRGDHVQPPVSNGDRIGYVIAVGKRADESESLADTYVRETIVDVESIRPRVQVPSQC